MQTLAQTYRTGQRPTIPMIECNIGNKTQQGLYAIACQS